MNGKELQTDNNLKWYAFGFRYYDPTLIRWNVPEPLTEYYFSFSTYIYCLNNPIRYVDFLGLDVTKKDTNTYEITGDDIGTYFSNLELAQKQGNWDNFYDALDAAALNNNYEGNDFINGIGATYLYHRNTHNSIPNQVNNSVSTGALFSSEYGGSMRFFKNNKLSIKYYNSGWQGGSKAKIKTYNLTKWGTRIGRGTSIISAGLGTATFMISDKSWGDYGRLGIAYLSAGLTYFPEPVTTGIGIGIGVIDAAGGFNDFYNMLDCNQQLYKYMGGIILPINGIPQYMQLKQ